MTDYATFIANKSDRGRFVGAGLPARNLPPALFPFQSETVEWALNLGRAAIFADTGLGKTLMQLAWAREVAEQAGPVLILTPLAVTGQTVREAARFGIEAHAVRERVEVGTGIHVTNYERLHLFDPSAFSGIVLDESSILKNYTGTTRRALTEAFSATPYRLACTATPAPNDHLELGTHAEFLGIMSSHRMIARWFIADQKEAGSYRLKGHAVKPYWDWVTSWARCIGRPSDMGPYSDVGYDLPPLVERTHLVAVDMTQDAGDGRLFREAELSATSMHREARLTAPERARLTAELVRAEPGEAWIVWVDTNYDADEVRALLPEAVEVRGDDSDEHKVFSLLGFSERGGVLITKPGIAGMGLNWQHCARMVFNGITFSFERYYQAVRRSYRFGQSREVHAHVVIGRTEAGKVGVLARKAAEHEAMKAEMFAASRRAASRAAKVDEYQPTHAGRIPSWLRSQP